MSQIHLVKELSAMLFIFLENELSPMPYTKSYFYFIFTAKAQCLCTLWYSKTETLKLDIHNE